MKYYSTSAQFEDLFELLDKDKWEADLVAALEEFKEDILKQMDITSWLTTKHKGSRKSMIENENGMCSYVLDHI